MGPVIAVDGSHLRGKYPGVLLVAVTYDADKKLFPIAFAFAEAERPEEDKMVIVVVVVVVWKKGFGEGGRSSGHGR